MNAGDAKRHATALITNAAADLALAYVVLSTANSPPRGVMSYLNDGQRAAQDAIERLRLTEME